MYCDTLLLIWRRLVIYDLSPTHTGQCRQTLLRKRAKPGKSSKWPRFNQTRARPRISPDFPSASSVYQQTLIFVSVWGHPVRAVYLVLITHVDLNNSTSAIVVKSERECYAAVLLGSSLFTSTSMFWAWKKVSRVLNAPHGTYLHRRTVARFEGRWQLRKN